MTSPRAAVFALAALAAAGCDAAAPSHVGAACRADGSHHDGCRDPSLYCSAAGTCEPRRGEGEVCDPAPCAEGLRCHIDKRCGVVRAEGEACAASFECTSGLRCNHGELPELFAVGLCRDLADEGEPCGYEHAPEEDIGTALPEHDPRVDRGDCRAGLSCAPVFPAPGGDESPPICADSKGVACFFAGLCYPDGTLPLGASCASSAACRSGVCGLFESPLSATPLPGFGKGGEWLGPRVGICVRPDDALADCDRNSPCPATFTCLDRRCVAPHSQRPGEVCSDVAGVECAFGLVCDGRECRYPAALDP